MCFEAPALSYQSPVSFTYKDGFYTSLGTTKVTLSAWKRVHPGVVGVFFFGHPVEKYAQVKNGSSQGFGLKIP